MPARLFPLANYVDLSSSRGMIALVWLIRQQGKINYPALYKAVFGQSLNQADDGFKTPTVNLQQILAFYQVLAQLLRNGIIESTPMIPVETIISMFQHYDPSNPDHNVVLRVADRVRFIQQLFDVSLTDITRKGVPIKSHPLFGDPIDDFDHTWTDVFVIMPFRDKFNDVYQKAIKPAVKDAGYTVRRGDDFFSDQRIMDEVWSAIYHSKLCIVECSDNNPNVFYELGIAHMLGRPTIMIVESDDDVPFDIRDRRMILYNNNDNGLEELRDLLLKTIKADMLLRHDTQ